MRVKTFGLVAFSLVGIACGHFGGGSKTPEGSFHNVGIGSPLDPTLKPARVLPEVVDEKETFGTEPGGGVRVITSGLRIVTSKEGGIVSAEDRFAQAPAFTTPLPDRLGGGFLFVLGTTVWRADRWLGTAKPIHTSTQPIQGVVPGLDRVYLKNASTFSAINGKTGEVLDLGPWPASPFVSSFAAADGWRAAAVTDLRGVVATFDAGATWRVLEVPIEARMVVLNGDTLSVGGVENQKGDNAWFDIRVDGSVSKLGIAPAAAKGKVFAATNRYYGGYYPGSYPYPSPYASANGKEPPPAKKDDAPVEDVSAGIRIFGKRPLASAIEDGWPLTDGTAMVARDGAIAKIKIADGTLVEMVPNAYPLKPSRCHPLSLTRPTAVGAFGFVCGEPRGQTAIYAYDPMKGRLTELKHFDKPRVVTSSGNGAIAVRGGCAEDADVLVSAGSIPKSEVLKPEKDDKDAKKKDPKKKDDEKDKEAKKDDKKDEKKDPPISEVHPYCVLGYDNTWREVHVRGDGSGERIVVLADGKIAVLSPPASQTAPARLTLLDKGKATTLAITYPKVSADVARVLRLGVWLDGFEERKPGVLGGWIEAGGAMLGIEVALDGKATPGQYVRDAGMPFVSGKYGLGWTSSRRGYETTDGGMTWTGIELPEPITSLNKVERRACGPIGCLAAGWLRVGWGEAKKQAVPATPPPARQTAQQLAIPNPNLVCEPLLPTEPAQPPPRVHAAAKDEAKPATPTPYSRRYPSPGVLAPAGGFQGLQDLPGFYAQGPMNLRDADRGLQFEAVELPEHYPRVGSLARVYAWGPKGGDWETLGKWQVKWLTPFSGWSDVKASAPVIPPGVIQDFTKTQPGYYGGYYGGYGQQWQMAPGDDASHALLITHRQMMNNQFVMFDLEADRAPIEVRRVDGEPFQEVEGIVRASGRWFLSTPPQPMQTLPTTTIWAVDGGVARELVRVPRAMPNEGGGRPAATHLARRSDGRAVGLVVEGQATNDGNKQLRWVLPIDLETGALGEPESVGYADLAGRTLDACTDDMVGWVFDASLPSTTIRMKLPNNQNGSMRQVYARTRLTSSRACMERVTGTFDQASEQTGMLTKAGAPARPISQPKPGEIIATPNAGTSRYALRCTIAPK